MFFDQTATSQELAETQIDLVILPIGAIEQHSGHLPLGTDWLIAGGLAERVARRMGQEWDVYLLPALPYSLSQCHGPSVGTVWLRPETFADLVGAIILGLSEQGVTRFLVINGHGGNFCLDAELCELNLSHPHLIALDAAWLRPLVDSGPAGRVKGGDIHAGAGETSLMRYLYPDRVKAEAFDAVPNVGREFLDYLYLPQISPSGVWGRPSEGTPQDGKAGLLAAVDHVVEAAPRCFDAIAAKKPAFGGGMLL
jgi:creatinine amidohydrolase